MHSAPRRLVHANEGIEAAHILDRKDQGPGQIRIHYNFARLPIGEVRTLAKRARAELDKQFGHLLRVAVAVEKLSDHPLAAAVVVGARELLTGAADLQAHGVQSIIGRGV